MASFFSTPPRNAAIKIVAPDAKSQDSNRSGSPKNPATPRKDSTQRQCRNILIHGYCKYEGKGCAYQHPPRNEPQQGLDPASARDEPALLTSASTGGTSIPLQAVHAPVFVPRNMASPPAIEGTAVYTTPPATGGTDGYESYQQPDLTVQVPVGISSYDGVAQQMEQMTFTDYGEHLEDNEYAHHDYNGIGAVDAFYQPQSFTRQPLNYHLYTLPVPKSEGRKFFISDDVREELLKRSEIVHQGSAPGLPLPEEVQGYHSLAPLEMPNSEKRKALNWSTTTYKAIKTSDGRAYALRRIENFRLMNEQAFTVLEKWTKLRHPSIVSVREAFTTLAFGDNSLVVVYDFHPNAQSLAELHFKSNRPYQGGRAQPERISEATLWSYIFQVASAMKAVHDAGLAVRMVDASKILLTGNNRVRISSCAIFDILLYDTRQDVFLMQQEDMIMFAKLIMSLACNNPAAVSNVHKSLDHVHRFYPGNIKDVIHFLMKAPGPLKNIQGLFDAFGGKLVLEMDAAHATVDRLEGELMGELENARLVRLLCKFGFINERPEFDRDPRWSETGDRYIIKLFRDYVFHSVDESGNPVVNLGHVLTNLNKLDAGSEERLMLVSRDEQSCLVVTYKEIKNCIEAAFGYVGLKTPLSFRVRLLGTDSDSHLLSFHSIYWLWFGFGKERGRRGMLSACPLVPTAVVAVLLSPAPAAESVELNSPIAVCLRRSDDLLLPTVEELAVKEDVRKLLERLIRTIEPQSRLLSFGSTANGFSLRNSDMDLVCLIDSEEKLSASDLVTMVGDLLERETKFHVKPLPHARIPIVKLSLDPSPGLPLGIACDIGFENRLALENTRLLLCYSLVDPTRVRTLVLFLKVWSKRRKINSPYEGTLSSYGYVLLVIYFLVHVKNPPVLPNLQQIPPLHPIPPEEHHMGNNNIWFFDDIELLRQRWKSQNTESVGELLIDFFRYYAKDFMYNTGVASIRAGLLRKEVKGWQNDNDPRFKGGGERNRLCIEDPFEMDYNVARCVTRDGLYIIRGEFMRASRILQLKQEHGYSVLAHLCEERDDSLTKPNGPYNTTFVPPRLSFPPQTPYSVGSHAFRPNGTPARDRLSPPWKVLKQNDPPILPSSVSPQEPPEHMAPKRIKFTSPPPPEAPDQDVASFESRLSQGLSLATSSTEAREQENAYMSSSSNSEVLSDDARSDIAQEDDAKSIQSFAGEPSSSRSRLPPGEEQQPFSSSSVPHRLSDEQLAMAYHQANFRTQEDVTPTPFAHGQYPRGRRPARAVNDIAQGLPPVSYRGHPNELRRFTFPGKSDGLRRSNSGPARAHHAPRLNFGTASVAQQMPFNVPLPPSPVHASLSSSPTIYYETNAQATGNSMYSPAPAALPINLTLYQQQFYLAHAYAQAHSQALAHSQQMSEPESLGDASGGQGHLGTRPVHSHTRSTSTIVGPPTPAVSSFSVSQAQSSPNDSSQQSSPSQSPGPTQTAFGRLPAIQPLQSINVLPSPTQSPLSSSFGSSSASSRSPQHVSVSRQSHPHFCSPHLSSQLSQFTRRHPQTPTHIHSFMQAQMHAQQSPFGAFGSSSDPSSLDLASPTDSPVSSGSSQGGSVSGSAALLE
ncbi:hypothetical protein ACEPAF_9100 [Sanghuangporus sanghuang]